MKKLNRSSRKVVSSAVAPIHRSRRARLWSVLPEVLEERQLMSTYVVNTSGDPDPSNTPAGVLSLREAILAANSDATPDTINFAMTGGSTISLGSALPQITNPLTIDAQGQTIELKGANAGAGVNGLDFESGSAGSSVTGLTIDSFQGAGVVVNAAGVSMVGNRIYGNNLGGVLVEGGGSNALIQNNVIGLDPTGQPFGNKEGIDVWGNVGATTPLQNVTITGNTITGNHTDGINLQAVTGVTIQGNFIGADTTGHILTDSFNNDVGGNYASGIEVGAGATAVQIGGGAGLGNVIMDNQALGISVDAGNASSVTIQGNDIGVDVSGGVADGNWSDGIAVQSGQVLIGPALNAPSAGLGNIIGGNSGNGISLNGGTTAIYGNYIGTDPNGDTGLGNYDNGIQIGNVDSNGNTLSTSSGNVIGSDQAGYGNVIADNGTPGYAVGGRGVYVLSGTGNTIAGNAVHDNALVGIDLSNGPYTPSEGPTANDSQGHAGPNNFQDYPVITSVVGDGTNVAIYGTISGVAGHTYTLDFFDNAAVDPGGNWEGQVYGGSMKVTIGSSGTASFTAILAQPTTASGNTALVEWTATATDDAGNTSEFSPGTQQTSGPVPSSISGVVTNDLTGNGFSPDDTPLAGWTVNLFMNGATTPIQTTVTASDGSFSFANLLPGTYTVQEVLPAGWTETGGAGGYSDTAISGQAFSGVNFDNFQNASIGGTVYKDATGNGYSSDDAPMGGVTVNLFLNGGTTPAASTTSAADGTYSFTNLSPGSYSVQEVVPSGYQETLGTSGYGLTPTSGQGVSTDNFDNYLTPLPPPPPPPTGQIGGYVFCDDNLNGVFDSTMQDGVTSAEIGQAGATVTLTGKTAAGVSVSLTTVTDGNGYYAFGGLAAGSYTVSLAGYSPNHQAEQSHGSVAISQSTTVSLTAGQALAGPVEAAAATNNGLDFAEIAPGGLQGFVWNDTNNDGKVDYNEAGIVNVTIQLNGVTYTGAKVSQTTVTDNSGEYVFANLQPGSYTMTEVTPGGYTDGKDSVGSLGGSETYLTGSASNPSNCSSGQTNYGGGSYGCGNASYNDCYTNYGYNCFTGYSNNCYSQYGNSGSSGCGGGSGYTSGQCNGGWSSGCNSAQNTFSNVQIGGCEDVGVGYNFGEKTPSLGSGSACHPTDTASLAFWHNCYGQALLCSLNGGQNSTALGNWLATMFPKMYGSQARVNFAGMTNVQIAAFYNANDFNVSGIKLDAAVLSAALSSYVTNSTWAGGNYATKYGFTVSAQGVGYDTINVGSNGAAFGVANNSTISILQALDATDQQSNDGLLYNGNTTLRAQAYNVYAAVAQNGLTT